MTSSAARPVSHGRILTDAKEPGFAPIVAVMEDTTMRKAISELDDEQRAVLLEIADFGTAAFSSGLIVAILKSVVDLFV